jgi:hypothetical protein
MTEAEQTAMDAVALHGDVCARWAGSVSTHASTALTLARAETLVCDELDDPLAEYNQTFDAPAHADDLQRNDRTRQGAEWAWTHGRNSKITLDSIAHWMGRLLATKGAEPIRTTLAFSRGGRLMHSAPVQSLWSESVFRWTSTKTASPYINAAGLYLDTIFFHPFRDGNARLARTLMLWSLRQSGVALPSLPMLIALVKRPGSTQDYQRFVQCTAISALNRSARRQHNAQQCAFNQRSAR